MGAFPIGAVRAYENTPVFPLLKLAEHRPGLVQRLAEAAVKHFLNLHSRFLPFSKHSHYNTKRIPVATLPVICYDERQRTGPPRRAERWIKVEYGLIGEKLGHSYSKLIHEKLADYTYDLTPLSREEFPAFMERRDFKAINVTIPYKKAVIPYLDELDENAAAIGAVNTIVNQNGRLTGHNTDFSGFEYMVRESGVRVSGKKALVLGTGGAAAAVLAVLKKTGAGTIVSVSRTGKDGAVTYEDAARLHADAGLIVNTTPVGMYPNVDASPLELSPFKSCEAVLDVIYNPGETRLTAQAKALGMKGVTGLSMLVAQAKYACEFFLETDLDDAVIPKITEEIAASMYHGRELK